MRPGGLIITVVIFAVMATSCTYMPKTKESQQAAKGAVNAPDAWATVAGKYGDISIKWLESFDDPVMLKLILEGKANNINLRLAAGNMEKAWLLARQAGAALRPGVDLSFGGTETGNVDGGDSVGNFDIGLTASWELDVWRRISAGVSAAQASAQAVGADYVYAQHSLSANIAKTYLKVIEAKLQTEISRKNVSILKETMRITKVKYEYGLSSGQDIALNRTNLASAQEQMIRLEGIQRDALRALELLLGRYPSASLEIPDALPDLPPQPPAGVPSEILERRPDIVSAERKIAAAFDAIAEAKAARLPRFSLTSSVSGASSSLSEVLDPSNMVWRMGANLLAPLLDGGKRKIDVELANVEQKQAISNYAQTALTAFSEVENNLDLGRVLADRKTALDEVFTQSGIAYHIADLRYKEGEIDLLDTLIIQQQAILAESDLQAIKRVQLEQRINLYLALGGGW